MKPNLTIEFDNSFANLPEEFYVKMHPEVMPELKLIRLNETLCQSLNIVPSDLQNESGVNFLGGKNILLNEQPLAQAYAGHQFGNFVPQLGDGRAMLLGEVIGEDGIRRDIQLKGSGKTPFSRMGDGRAGLGPVLREYIVSEGMAGLKIPTTRALAALLTGETVVRDIPVPGAILTRVAESHIRIGTFQYFAHKGQTDQVKTLANYVIKRHYPHLEKKKNKYLMLLDNVIQKQADLIANWMGVGFIHGVMNTDNMTLSGETIDFGPCAFMDSFDVNQVYSSIDAQGRYRYSNQPYIAVWNLSRFAETILPLISKNQEEAIKLAETSLEKFLPTFSCQWTEIMGKKLGLKTPQPDDRKLIETLLELMQAGQADFTLTFRNLSKVLESDDDNRWLSLFSNKSENKNQLWLQKWKKRLATEKPSKESIIKNLNSTNPCIIPRNHLIEVCISDGLKGNFEQFQKLTTALEHPFLEHLEFSQFSKPPEKSEIVRETFCGT